MLVHWKLLQLAFGSVGMVTTDFWFSGNGYNGVLVQLKWLQRFFGSMGMVTSEFCFTENVYTVFLDQRFFYPAGMVTAVFWLSGNGYDGAVTILDFTKMNGSHI